MKTNNGEGFNQVTTRAREKAERFGPESMRTMKHQHDYRAWRHGTPGVWASGKDKSEARLNLIRLEARIAKAKKTSQNFTLKNNFPRP